MHGKPSISGITHHSVFPQLHSCHLLTLMSGHPKGFSISTSSSPILRKEQEENQNQRLPVEKNMQLWQKSVQSLHTLLLSSGLKYSFIESLVTALINIFFNMTCFAQWDRAYYSSRVFSCH